MPATEDMTVYSVDLSESIENYNWNPETDLLRLDFGDRANTELVIRNIHFRQRNTEENDLHLEKEAFKTQDKQTNDQIANYLSNTYDSFITRVEVQDSIIIVNGSHSSGDGKAMLYAVKPCEDIIKPEEFNGVELPQSPFSI